MSSAVTDDDGFYTAGELEEGYYRIEVEHADYADATLENVAAGSQDVDVVLESGAVIEGRIIDGISGEPITEFEILHIDKNNRNARGVRRRFERRRSNDGRFAIAGVEPGRVTIVARANGYGRSEAEVAQVRPGVTIDNVEIQLLEGVSVEGSCCQSRGRAGIQRRDHCRSSAGSRESRGSMHRANDCRRHLCSRRSSLRTSSSFRPSIPNMHR